MDTPPKIIVPTTTLIGGLMRISDRARVVGRERVVIESDAHTMLELRKMLAEDIGARHQLFRIDGHDYGVVCMIFDNIELKIRKHPCT